MHEHRCGDPSVIAVVTHCCSLRALAVGGSPLVTDASAAAIAEHCGARLNILHLGRSIGITDEGVAALAKRCTALRTLHVSPFNVCITPAAIAGYVTKCPLLQDLDLVGCEDSAVVMDALAEHCPLLRVLNVYQAQRVTQDCVQKLLSKCCDLRTIGVSEETGLELGQGQGLGWRAEYPQLKVVTANISMRCWSQWSYTDTGVHEEHRDYSAFP